MSPQPRPADECQYPKPFPPDFIDCPAYQATQMVTLDLSHRPLGSVITCRHLESRLMRNTNYRWYGACVLGDADARRWSNTVGVGRLHDISTLRQEVSARSAPYVQQLLDLKNAPVGDNPLAHTRQLQAMVDEFITKVTALLRERKGALSTSRWRRACGSSASRSIVLCNTGSPRHSGKCRTRSSRFSRKTCAPISGLAKLPCLLRHGPTLRR